MAEETTISEAPATESGAENDNAGILTVEDLANSFAERVEADAEETPTETEATEATEAEGAEAVEEEDVLSKSISQEDDDETPEEEAEAEEPAEEKSEGESPAVGRLLKQVGKLTARAKGAEEANEAMKAEIASLKTQGTGGNAEAQGSPDMDDVETIADLEKVRQEALSAKKWALSHLGKDYVESEGKEYDGDHIRKIFAAAEEYLTERIPARGQFIQSREQWRADARTTYPWLDLQEGPMYDLYLQIRSGAEYAEMLDSLPQGDFVGATLARGIKGARDDQEAAKGKPKKKTAQAKPPPSQEGDAAPPVKSKKARQKSRKTKALGKGVISESQLAAYLTD